MTLSIGVILLNVFKVILNAFRSHLLLYLSQKLDIALLLGYYRHIVEYEKKGIRFGEEGVKFEKLTKGMVDAFVKEGDVLYVLSIEELSDTIVRYQNEFNDAEARLKILSAYKKSLDGDISELEDLTDNPYYEELINRKELLCTY